MEGVIGEIIYPTIEQIIEINRRMITVYGGLFLEPNNCINIYSLEYIVEAIQSDLFGFELYPSITSKAGALAFHIITKHVFNDGNKRTGVLSAWEFLHANNINLELDHSIVDLALSIARGESEEDDLVDWFNTHMNPE